MNTNLDLKILILHGNHVNKKLADYPTDPIVSDYFRCLKINHVNWHEYEFLP